MEIAAATMYAVKTRNFTKHLRLICYAIANLTQTHPPDHICCDNGGNLSKDNIWLGNRHATKCQQEQEIAGKDPE